jgi:UDP-N-acetylmuramoyl-tripeptide--D-alanyl-D-alanine ligase
MSQIVLIFLLVYLSIYLILLIKQILYWLFLWQNKQYRWDKMRDYLGLPESNKTIFDKWTLLRLGWILFLIFYVLVHNFFNPQLFLFSSDIQAVLIILNGLFCFFEILEFILKLLLRKKILLPKFTPKIAIVLLLTFLTLFILPFVLVHIFKLNLFVILILNFSILYIPIIISSYLFLFVPFQVFLEKRTYLEAKRYRLRLENLKTVAISGAFGKSTTKEILYQLLSPDIKTAKTLKNYNANISCAKFLLGVDEETEVFIAELGAYKVGDGREICEFILPDVAIITGLNMQHYSLFGSKENILKAETESLSFLKSGSLAAVNWSSPMCREIDFPENLRIVKYGIPENSEQESEFDFYATDLVMNQEGSKFKLVSTSGIFEMQTNLVSKGNIENLLGAIVVALELGGKIENIITKINNLETLDGTLYIQNKDWGKLIDDSYNANLDGVSNSLDILKIFEMQKIVFLDDILELGAKSYQSHIQVAKKILETNPDKVILLGRNFSIIIKNHLLENQFPIEKILIWNEQNTSEISNLILKDLAENQSVLLFEGFQSRKFINFF